MTLPIAFRPEAAADVVDARDYYDRRQPGLGARFAAALEDVLASIAQNPELFAVILRTVRRVKLRRFPYVVYYRVLSDCIEVIGVMHGSRHSQTWQSRAD
jgi:plasmid stabilization system protein ParE